jgi:hypothetical protein
MRSAENASGMNRRKLACIKPDFKVHQRGNGEPAFDSGRPLGEARSAARFVVPDKQIEFGRDPNVRAKNKSWNQRRSACVRSGAALRKGFFIARLVHALGKARASGLPIN